MSAARRSSKNRAVWITLAACAAFGALGFLALKALSGPRPPVVVPPQESLLPAPARPDAPPTTPREVAPRDSAVSTQRETPPPSAVRPDQKSLVHGRVLARSTGAIARAEIVLRLERGTLLEALGSVVSDARGEFAFTSEALARALGTDRLLRIDVDASGYQPTSARFALASVSAEHGLEAEVELTPGARVFGRVVGPGGSAAPNAVVTILVPKSAGAVTEYKILNTTPCSAEGRFSLGFASSGAYRLTARAEGIGTGVLAELDLEAGVDRTIEDIVLAGGAPIKGRAQSPTGEPIRDLELWAIDTNYANEVEALSKAVLRIAADERADGLSLTKTQTDENGQFELSGLRPGHYALRSPDRLVVMEPRQARYEPGTENVEIVVSSPRVVVRVLEADGTPAATGGVRITELSRRLDGTYEPSATRTRGWNDRRGYAAFTLDPETPAAVQAFDGRRTSVEEIVMLAQNEGTRELTLTLLSDAPAGRVRFDVIGEDGAPLEKLVVEARSSSTNVVRDDLGLLESDERGVVGPLPAGSYQFTIGYPRGTERDHFVLRTSDPVVVRSGQETLVSLRARRGARVEVEIRMKSAPPGFDSGAKLEADERRDRFGSRVVLTPATGGAGIQLAFRPKTGPGIVGQLLPGEVLVSDTLLEPGSYDLALASNAFVLASPVRVVLAPGATASCLVAVLPR